jgi:ribonuclease P protein component
MLRKELRLKKKSEIEQLFKSGKTSKSIHFVCKLSKNDLGFNRPCVTIARNLKLNVPAKNRLKRQIIAAFESATENLTNDQTYDIIIILQKIPSFELKRFVIFQKELATLLNQ